MPSPCGSLRWRLFINRSLRACAVIAAIKRARAAELTVRGADNENSPTKGATAKFSQDETLYCFDEDLINIEDQVYGARTFTALHFAEVRIHSPLLLRAFTALHFSAHSQLSVSPRIYKPSISPRCASRALLSSRTAVSSTS